MQTSEAASRIDEFDLVVIGSGAAGLTAALCGASQGARVLVVEKEDLFGGASARSGGGVWIPNSPHAARAGVTDSPEAALEFLRTEAGERFDSQTAKAFIEQSPRMISFVETNTAVRFTLLRDLPDYHCERRGGSTGGRSLAPHNWDARPLGAWRHRLRPPLKSSTFLGMQIGIAETSQYFSAARRFSSALYVAKCILLRLRDQLRAGRTMRLASGNALVGGLAAACLARGVELWISSPARRLVRDKHGSVIGADVETENGLVRVKASKGVILATGGFPHDAARRAHLFPAGSTTGEVWAALPYGNSGDGIRMAEEVEGNFASNLRFPVALTPSTRMHAGEGMLQVMPCFHNLGKPGIIAVTRNGQRFCNESRSYHDIGAALVSASQGDEEGIGWLVFDYLFLRRWGVGPIAPAPVSYSKHIKSGYLKRSRTFRELAESCGMNCAGLEATVDRFNKSALLGKDLEFGRGSSVFDLAMGDPDNVPNPCLRPLSTPPYFAIRVFAGVVATFAGLRADCHARVLDSDGQPVPGLYVAGNDMESITGGDYVAGGCTLGPGMTFGFIAANHAIAHRSARAQRKVDSTDEDMTRELAK